MKLPGSALLFQHPTRKVRRAPLRHYLAELTEKVAAGRSITCLITTDGELQRLNREFRGADYPTDVLSFPAAVNLDENLDDDFDDDLELESASKSVSASKLGQGPQSPLGDIAISFDRAAAQAAELGHEVDAELRILMLHGVLHLTGLDHESDDGAMAAAEAEWRVRFGLPAGLIERAER